MVLLIINYTCIVLLSILLYVCLVFYSIPTRKQLIWEPSKGNINFGDEDGSDLASEVFIFMVVSLTKCFKCPVVFFYDIVFKFANKLTSQQIN